MISRFPVTCAVCGEAFVPRQTEIEEHPSLRGPRGGKKMCHVECIPRSNPAIRRNFFKLFGQAAGPSGPLYRIDKHKDWTERSPVIQSVQKHESELLEYMINDLDVTRRDFDKALATLKASGHAGVKDDELRHFYEIVRV